MQSVRRGAAVVLASGLLVTALTACGPAPWNQASSASPTPTSTATAVPAPVENDLSSGSTEREVTAGAVAATINYWSTLSMDQWTATSLKPISLSMSTTVTPNDGQKVYLQRAVMVAVPGNATETFAALDPQIDESSVNPGYLVLDPYSYSQTFNMGEVPAGATFVTVQFTYDFLVQAAPDSTEFAKQTATDSLTIAIAASPASGTEG
ncbi:hypothetical protein FHX48_001956 [Microbacterium halimionae]|uniref:Uncharacterized protein n=1 Tax=Microbacterium halimionae TaxID=1526413 RepID=A0A7W3JQ09_9MICO|nr:hypothetical protein [Microbacterium halimionae]MBA8816863.1 hypothetical protein [Microbacterium halimionae]NII94841.1 hypothetical protein [Microbacterium halimionae]